MRGNYYKPNTLTKKLRYFRHKLSPWIERTDDYFNLDMSRVWKCHLKQDQVPYNLDKVKVKDPHKYIGYNEYHVIDNALPEELNKSLYELFTKSNFKNSFQEVNQHNRSCQISYKNNKETINLKKELSKLLWLKMSEPLDTLAPYMEVQFTRSGNWDFFGPHIDPGCNTHEFLTGRKITYVYYVQQEPRKYKGGELNLWLSSKDTKVIEPVNNRLVVMYPWTYHLIKLTRCKSLWDHGRFTVNGWLWDEWSPDGGMFNTLKLLRESNG